MVVGGGVVGLAVAWELARAEQPVVVVDPGDPSSRATWAAGGMLAPLGEARAPGPFLDFGLHSLSLYPGFVRELEAASGLDVGLHLDGKLLAALTGADEERLRSRLDWLVGEGHPVRWLDPGELRDLEPRLAPTVRGAILLEGNGRVNNRLLQDALEGALERRGVPRVSGRVEEVLVEDGRVAGVHLDEGAPLAARRVVVAAGAWSGELLRLPHPRSVTPVKGQMLSFAAPDRPLNRVVTTPRIYLIPRESPDGPVVVAGATEERTGFDGALSSRGQALLEAGAVELVPGLANAPVTERWSGFRPGTPDDLPLVGPHPEIGGLLAATGHYRNGILLAPATARAVRKRITRGIAPEPPAFRPARLCR